MQPRDVADVAVLGAIASVMAWILGTVIGGTLMGLYWATLTLILFGAFTKFASES